ncbi:MAG TPA: glycerol-3-phosphate dehydrogenase/oxidase [Gemmatimonadales bacterium]|nr:glycerol-3-phosphate dehydrogenase/oxidase [Gemmatimonadales bacterium]
MRRNLAALASREFDVVVVGGGVTGAAIAWDAAQRGLSVALVERDDFGAATSANSLKVIHGGIRYLQHLDIPRVRESCRERSAWLRIAPHLTRPMPVLVPTFGHGMRGPEALGAAFTLLQLLTFDRNRGLPSPERRIPRARLISKREALERSPDIAGPGLNGAGLFWDGQLTNPTRLVWELVRTAGRAGAEAANHCEVRGFLRRGGRVEGVTVHDRLGNDTFDVRGRVVINAAGPFAEQLYVRDGIRPTRHVPLSRDMALVIRRPLVRGQALAMQTGYRDPDAVLSRGARHLFIMPWRDVTLIGVNSIVYPGDPYALGSTAAEVEEFVREIDQAVPTWRLTPSDVAMVYAGLLPIGSGTLRHANVSFGKRPYLADNARTDGLECLITAIANRYTIARGLGERAVDMAFQKLGAKAPACRTETTPLWGGEFTSMDALVREARAGQNGGLTPDQRERLARVYGSGWPEVARLIAQDPSLGGALGAGPMLKVEVAHAVRHEMAGSLADCVFTRTELGTAGNPGEDALASCAAVAARELGWGSERTDAELSAVRSRFRVATAV